MIQLQQKYALRLEKMGLNSLCFFFIFWISVYILLMIVNHLGPALYTSQLITSPTNRCVDEIQNWQTSSNSIKLPYYQCYISFKPIQYGIKDTLLIRTVALLNNKNITISQYDKYQIAMSQLINIELNSTKAEDNNEFVPKDIEYDKDFPYLNDTQVDQTKWKIISNNKTTNLTFNCNIKNIGLGPNYEGCYSEPIFDELKEDIKQEYQFFIRINKTPFNDSLSNANKNQNNTKKRLIRVDNSQQIDYLNEFNQRFLQETIDDQEQVNNENQENNKSSEDNNNKNEENNDKNEEKNDKNEENKDNNDEKQEDAEQKKEKEEKTQQNEEKINNNKDNQENKIRKILFQLKYKNSNHKLETIMKSLYSIVTAGFLVYTLISLKNFYVDQLISIQKWIRYLLAFLLIYNSPLHLFFPQNNGILLVSKIGQIVFISLIMYFWLSIKSMNRPSQTAQHKSGNSSMKGLKNFLKVLLICLHNAPRFIWSFLMVGGVASILSSETDRQLNSYENIDFLHKLSVGTFFIYGLCVFGAMLKVCIESSIDRNFKFLCYFTYSVFYTYGYISYQELFIPEENQSSYFMLNKETILNIYVYVISYLYLPVENKNDEQQYNLDHNPDNGEEEEEQKKKEIIGEVYKDIEMDETIKNHSHIHNTSSEQKKQKLWETIQKSIEDEEDEYEQKQNDDSSSSSDSDKQSSNNSSAKKLEKKKHQREQDQIRKQKFVDDAQEELDDQEFIFE